MLRATSIVRRPAVKADKVADTLTLDHQARHRRRISMTGEGGLSFLLDLDRSVALDDGDAIKLDDGRLVRVVAAPERLIEVRTANPLRLMKVAWHLGNRHVATEIADDALYLAHDHVLLDMLRGLGAATTDVMRPFRPERGAYEETGAHDDGAGHDHTGHAHGSADHSGHAHGAACGCGHDHAHDHGHEHHDHAAHDHAPAAHAEAPAGSGHAAPDGHHDHHHRHG